MGGEKHEIELYAHREPGEGEGRGGGGGEGLSFDMPGKFFFFFYVSRGRVVYLLHASHGGWRRRVLCFGA